MQGYSTIVSELRSQVASVMKEQDNGALNQNWFSHVFLQAGVGSFAGGIAAALVNATRSGCPFMISLPKIIVVEPKGAHCFFLSHNMKDGNFHGRCFTFTTDWGRMNRIIKQWGFIPGPHTITLILIYFIP